MVVHTVLSWFTHGKLCFTKRLSFFVENQKVSGTPVRDETTKPIQEDNIRKISDIRNGKIPGTRFWNPNRTADAYDCMHSSEFVYKLRAFVRRGSVKGTASGAGAVVLGRGGRLPSQRFSTATTRDLKFERVESLPKQESRTIYSLQLLSSKNTQRMKLFGNKLRTVDYVGLPGMF